MATSGTVTAGLRASVSAGTTIDGVTDPALDFVMDDTNGVFTKVLNATSTPAVTKGWQDQVALSGGAVTIDLTALALTGLTSVDFTGLKVQAVKIKVSASATGAMTFVPGATTGYNIFGASGSLVLPPGGVAVIYAPEGWADVGAGAKNIDVSGTGTETFWIEMVAG